MSKTAKSLNHADWEFITGVFEHLPDTDVRRKLLSMAKDQNLDLFRYEIEPRDYTTAYEFKVDNFAANVFGKIVNRSINAADMSQKTLSKFLGNMQHVRAWNHAFENQLLRAESYDLHTRAGKKLRKLMGDISIYTCLESARFGPGSTVMRTGNKATPLMKYAGPYTISEQLYNYLLNLDADRFEKSNPWLFNIVVGSSIGVDLIFNDKVEYLEVPKNLKTNRVIMLGNDLNVYVQLGIETEMSKRLAWRFDYHIRSPHLKRYARLRPLPKTGKGSIIDYSITGESQQEKHARLIRDNHASVATEDKSGGSDTVSLSQVKFMLEGTELLEILTATRLGLISFKRTGCEYVFELPFFGGAGDGTVFPLETAVFCCIAKAAAEILNIAVHFEGYGDDLLLLFKQREGRAEEFWKFVYQNTPFKLNKRKSFDREEHYKETCGEETFDGHSVWPARCRNLPELYKFPYLESLKVGAQKALTSKGQEGFVKYFNKQLKGKSRLARNLRKELKSVHCLYSFMLNIDIMRSEPSGFKDPRFSAVHRYVSSLIPSWFTALVSTNNTGHKKSSVEYDHELYTYCTLQVAQKATSAHFDDRSRWCYTDATGRQRHNSVPTETILAYIQTGGRLSSAGRSALVEAELVRIIG